MTIFVKNYDDITIFNATTSRYYDTVGVYSGAPLKINSRFRDLKILAIFGVINCYRTQMQCMFIYVNMP